MSAIYCFQLFLFHFSQQTKYDLQRLRKQTRATALSDPRESGNICSEINDLKNAKLITQRWKLLKPAGSFVVDVSEFLAAKNNKKQPFQMR